jgi:hypothetical protein
VLPTSEIARLRRELNVSPPNKPARKTRSVPDGRVPISEPAPLCRCGCFQRVSQSKQWPGYWNAFVKAHHQRGMWRGVGPLYGPAPACACGCGRATKPEFHGARWNRYLPHHMVKEAARRSAQVRAPRPWVGN